MSSIPTRKNFKKVRYDGRSEPRKPQVLIIRHDMLNHPKFRKLSGAAVKVLLEISSRHNGFNNAEIGYAHSDLASNLGLGKATVGRAIEELELAGFLVCAMRGVFTDCRASLWYVTFLTSKAVPPNNLWLETGDQKKSLDFRNERVAFLSDTAAMIKKDRF